MPSHTLCAKRTCPHGPVSYTVHSRCVKQSVCPCSCPDGLARVLKQHFNQSQQAAIEAAVSCSAQYVLVQGPPGTGKTSAIVGMISAVLAGSNAAYGNDSWPLALAATHAQVKLAKLVLLFSGL